MGRLAAIFGALLGVLLVPLALAGPTSLLILPAHALLSTLTTAAALGEGFAGRPRRARWWGVGFVGASLAMIAALELGAEAQGGADGRAWYWVAPWAGALLWGWVPPAAALVGSWVGELRRSALARHAVNSRRPMIEATES